MFLGKTEILITETLGIQTGIDVALERQNGLPGIIRRKRCVPGLEALGVQLPEFVADAHQVADLMRFQLLELVNQFTGIVQEIRLGMGFRCQGALIIQSLGRGDDHQHVRGSSLQKRE